MFTYTNTDEMIFELEKYTSTYSALERKARSGFKRLIDILLDLPEEMGKVCIQNKNGSFVRFQFLGFKVLIRFVKNVIKNKGCIQWYYIFFDPEYQREKGKKIFEYYFDKNGKIYSDESTIIKGLSFEHYFRCFIYQNLLDFCQKVDEDTYSEFQKEKETKK